MAQRGRPKKNISEIKELISNIKPATEPEYAVGVDKYATSECAKGEITIVTKSNPPSTYVSKNGIIEISKDDPNYDAIKAMGDHYAGLMAKDWKIQVENYCSLEAITPLELIEQHKSFKKQLNARKTPENKAQKDEKWIKSDVYDKIATSNYFSDYAKRKSQGNKS